MRSGPSSPRRLRGHTEPIGQLSIGEGVYAVRPANAVSDDIVIYKGDLREEPPRLPMLRHQEMIADGRPNRSPADFIAPKELLVLDYIGMFAVTAGIGAEALAKQFEADHDDYNAILVKALADRQAEAFADYLHAQGRKDWGYKKETPGNEDLIAERCRGTRPAYRYPACPDHSEKFKLFDLLDARRMGINLTEHRAMTPATSVSGLYLSHRRRSTSTRAASTATSWRTARGGTVRRWR